MVEAVTHPNTQKGLQEANKLKSYSEVHVVSHSPHPAIFTPLLGSLLALPLPLPTSSVFCILSYFLYVFLIFVFLVYFFVFVFLRFQSKLIN